MARHVDQLALPRELLANLTLRELRGKFKQSTLGWAWSLINPLTSLLVYGVVFSVFLRVQPPVGDPSGLRSYAIFLVTALLPWTFVAAATSGAVNSLLGNAGLIKKVYFPRVVLPAAGVLAQAVQLGLELVVLVVALLLIGNMVLPWLGLVLAVLVLQLAFVLGIALALSVLNVYFRDVEHLTGIALNVWFYATPIIYPLAIVPLSHPLLGVDIPMRALVRLNPMFWFVDAYRDLLYHLRFPPAASWLWMAGAAVLSLTVGWLLFRRFEPRLAEEL